MIQVDFSLDIPLPKNRVFDLGVSLSLGLHKPAAIFNKWEEEGDIGFYLDICPGLIKFSMNVDVLKIATAEDLEKALAEICGDCDDCECEEDAAAQDEEDRELEYEASKHEG